MQQKDELTIEFPRVYLTKDFITCPIGWRTPNEAAITFARSRKIQVRKVHR